jgi:hypothetical protein
LAGLAVAATYKTGHVKAFGEIIENTEVIILRLRKRSYRDGN